MHHIGPEYLVFLHIHKDKTEISENNIALVWYGSQTCHSH